MSVDTIATRLLKTQIKNPGMEEPSWVKVRTVLRPLKERTPLLYSINRFRATIAHYFLCETIAK